MLKEYATSNTTNIYKPVSKGVKDTSSYRIYIENSNLKKIISPFHDIPLRSSPSENNVFNAIIEIPRWTNAKMEINKKEKLNPIIQDKKNNKLRFVNNVFPYHGYIWNYGAFPQTWEDPNVVDKETGCVGDNDPLDICEIGTKVHQSGSVIKVKALGSLGLIDDGEADWKIIVIDVNDPLAEKLNDISDVEKHLPGLLEATRDWFKIYKIPTGKSPNRFASNGKYFDKKFTFELINHDHKSWANIFDKNLKNEISKANTCLNNSNTISQDEANSLLERASSSLGQNEIDQAKIDELFYVNRNDLK